MSASIEREHGLGLQPLAQRVRVGQAAKLGQKFCLAPKLELCLDPFLERDKAQLLEALHLAAGELLVGQLAVGLPAPQSQRASEERGRQGGIPVPRR
ncbi:MAG TPA: hypothetical protein VIF85_10580 [Gaiellaceae bacterium]